MGGLSSPPQLSIICASGSSHLRNGVLMWPIQVMTLLFSLKPKTTRRKKLSAITGSLAPYVQAKTHFKLACLVPKLFNNRHWIPQPKYEMFVSAQSFRSVYFVTLTRRWIRLWSVKFVPFPTNWILMSSAECLCSEECCHVVVQMNKLRVDDTGEIWSFAHIVLTCFSSMSGFTKGVFSRVAATCLGGPTDDLKNFNFDFPSLMGFCRTWSRNFLASAGVGSVNMPLPLWPT